MTVINMCKTEGQLSRSNVRHTLLDEGGNE
jgi:hypothetical protein